MRYMCGGPLQVESIEPLTGPVVSTGTGMGYLLPCFCLSLTQATDAMHQNNSESRTSLIEYQHHSYNRIRRNVLKSHSPWCDQCHCGSCTILNNLFMQNPYDIFKNLPVAKCMYKLGPHGCCLLSSQSSLTLGIECEACIHFSRIKDSNNAWNEWVNSEGEYFKIHVVIYATTTNFTGKCWYFSGRTDKYSNANIADIFRENVVACKFYLFSTLNCHVKEIMLIKMNPIMAEKM